MILLPAPTTNDFFAAAYKVLGGRDDIEPDSLLIAASSTYIYWRDRKIEEWATAVYDRHGESLVPLYGMLLDMVMRLDESYYIGAMSSCVLADGDTSAEALAYVVAVIRWYSNVRAGRVHEIFPATEDDARQWLEQYGFAPVKPGQMSLFLDM